MPKTLLKIAFYGLVVVICLPSAAQQMVSFNSLDGTVIKAMVFHPPVLSHNQTNQADQPNQANLANQANASRGTVIALHGCGGLYAATGSRQGQLTSRSQAMGDLLVAEGYSAVFPDSLTPRGETELCTQKISSRKIDQTQRRADVLGALAWAAGQPWALPNRIALIGWSHGGSAVLAATDASRADVCGQAVKPAIAVAFYPGCAAASKAGYQPNAPLVLMLGEKDDWTPPAPCVALASSAGAEVNVYADSYHDFDNPTGTVRLRKDVPNGINPGLGVHAGPNPVARQQAYARLTLLLATALKP